MTRVSLALAVLVVAGLSGCSSSEVLVAHQVELVPASETIPEERLLDVAINVFDPGVPEGEVDKEVLEELLSEGTFVHIRRAEARYLAVELRNTLQRSGRWGRVWVTPESTTAADLNVSAEIVNSDGDRLVLRVSATDASGRVWIDEAQYSVETAAAAYNRQRYPELDAYQDAFNEIANDLSVQQSELSAAEVETLRQIAELRFAAELSPDSFAGYVEETSKGYTLARLPAADDPMYARTRSIRQREFLFLDTLNQHYSQFHGASMSSYDGWRQYAREEAISVRELTRSARWRTGLGIATIVASLVYSSNSSGGDFSDRVVRDALMYIGMDVVRSASVHRQEKRLHTQTLEELSESFDDEVKPLVVDIQGTQHRLTGTADLQYEEWRQLLRDLFIEETGFVPAIEVYEDPEAGALTPSVEVVEGGSPEAPASPVSGPPAAEAEDADSGA